MTFKGRRIAFAELFDRWAETAEKYLIRAVVLAMVMLMVAQALTFDDPARFYMSFSQRLNQEVAEFNRQHPEARPAGAPVAAFATVTVRLTNFSSLQKAKLLVNGKEMADFRDKQVTVKVNPGDVIAVDGSFYSRKLQFKVVKISGNVVSPGKGEIITVEQNVVPFPAVKLSEIKVK